MPVQEDGDLSGFSNTSYESLEFRGLLYQGKEKGVGQEVGEDHRQLSAHRDPRKSLKSQSPGSVDYC